MVDDDPPDTLYKFRPLRTEEDWKRLKQILVERKLWFSSLDQFNDPFEGHVSLFMRPNDPKRRSWSNRLTARYGAQTRSERRNQKRRILENTRQGMQLNQYMPSSDFGVCCLMDLAESDDPSKDILSWSHYAGGHKGVAVGFRVGKSLPLNMFSYAHRVHYYDVKPTVDVLHIDKWSGSGVLAKAKCWTYEREWRLLSIDTPRDPHEIRADIEAGEIAEGGALHEFLMFPPCVNSNARIDAEDIVEVRIGARTDEKDRQRIFEILKESELSLRVIQSDIDPAAFRLVYSDCVRPTA